MQTVDAKFEGCKATTEFCKIINNAFDILNRRKLYSKKPYNSAINNDNFEKYQLFTMEFQKYINDLKFEDGTNVIDSKRKTGFKGIAMGLQSALDLFKLLISKNHMKFFITYKISQDHLETFFCAIRSKGGYNDNPTCRQFQAAYKRLLVHNSIMGSAYGNCSILDNTYIEAVSNNKTLNENEELNFNFNWLTEKPLLHHDYFENVEHLNPCIEDVCVYIAGFVTMKAIKKIACTSCTSYLLATTQNSKLATVKDRGSLIKPSLDVQTVCIVTEKVFREYNYAIMNKTKSKFFVLNKVKINLYSKFSIFNNMTCVNYDNCLFDKIHQFDNHRDKLIHLLSDLYYKIRLFHEVRKLNDKDNFTNKAYENNSF